MSSVCLYGGSFNPVHTAHLILAETAREILDIPQITFVPAPTPPHKDHLLPYDVRYQMLSLAIQGNPAFSISEVEKVRGGISYTIDTVRFFLQDGNHDRVFLLIGADSLLELPTWRNWQELLELATVVVVNRTGGDLSRVNNNVMTRVKVIETPTLDISARDIRRRIMEGKSIRYLVPESVREFIITHKLYQ